MEWGLTSAATGIATECGYYCGRPYRWDSVTRRIVEIHSRKQIIRWAVEATLMTIIKVIIVVFLIRMILQRKLRLSEWNEFVHICYAVGFVWSIMFEWHTFLRSGELRVFLNTTLDFFEKFLEKYSRQGVKRKKNWAPVALLFFISALVGTAAGLGFIYMLDCKIHVLYPIVDVDTCWTTFWKNGLTVYACIYIFAMTVFQLLFVLQTVATAFPYLTVAAPAVFIGLNIITELRIGRPGQLLGTKAILRTRSHWILNYKCFQIFVIVANTTLFEIVIPLVLAFSILLHISILYLMITMSIGIVTIIALLMETLLISVYFFILDRLAKFDEISNLIKSDRAPLCNDKYLRACIKSLAPIRLRNGSFSYFGKQTIVLICFGIVGRVVDLLILRNHQMK